MTSRLDRRSFIKTASLGAGALSAGTIAAGILAAPSSAGAAAERKEKLNVAIIGCGGRGRSHLDAVKGENLVAIVDVDESHFGGFLKGRAGQDKNAERVQTFTDYRVLFDKLHKQLDAVFIATPNHQHAPPTMIAMQLGLGVYCEKPLCHDVAEARRVRGMAEQYKVATQMGNQGHCSEGYRRLCEFIWAGAIGPVHEAHCWADRANGGSGPRPPAQTPPKGMHWNEWIGPAPYREFHADLHPHEWHGWFDFGNGSLGNMACHVMDGVVWALKAETPTHIELESVAGGTDERYPTGCRIRWDVPARGDLPPLAVYWYDGFTAGTGEKGRGPHYLPPLLEKLKTENPDVKFDTCGTLYIGEKGVLYTNTYGGGMRLFPKERMQEFVSTPKTLPRPQGSFADFIRAVKEGKTDTATSFDYASRLTEFTLLGNLAQHAGVGNKIEWDAANMKVVNLPDLNRWLKREYRTGWQV